MTKATTLVIILKHFFFFFFAFRKIRPCPSAVNPNCVSTSSATSPIASAPVIRAPVKSLEDLAAELTGIVLSVDSSAKVTASKRVGDTYYLQVERLKSGYYLSLSCDV